MKTVDIHVSLSNYENLADTWTIIVPCNQLSEPDLDTLVVLTIHDDDKFVSDNYELPLAHQYNEVVWCKRVRLKDILSAEWKIHISDKSLIQFMKNEYKSHTKAEILKYALKEFYVVLVTKPDFSLKALNYGY